jgi:hypothetical protein
MQEATLICGAAVSFRIQADGLPSGLRRGLDRLGMANLAKGHADITLVEPQPPKQGEEKTEQRANDPSVLHYHVSMPYADLKIRFGDGRGVLMNVFGKRSMLMGVPAFLDDSLQPWRERLKEASRGLVPLDAALEARAIRDALMLELSGQGDVKNYRKLYSVGFSPNAMQEILTDMRRALNYYTRHVRVAVAIGGGLLAAGLLAGFMLLPWHAQMQQGWPWTAGLLSDLVFVAVLMGLSWAALSGSMRVALRRRFPNRKISLRRNVGKTGWIMLGGIATSWLLMLVFMPAPPLWLSYLMGLINHGR